MIGGNAVRKLDVQGSQRTNEAVTALGFKSHVSSEPKMSKVKSQEGLHYVKLVYYKSRLTNTKEQGNEHKNMNIIVGGNFNT